MVREAEGPMRERRPETGSSCVDLCLLLSDHHSVALNQRLFTKQEAQTPGSDNNEWTTLYVFSLCSNCSGQPQLHGATLKAFKNILVVISSVRALKYNRK